MATAPPPVAVLEEQNHRVTKNARIVSTYETFNSGEKTRNCYQLFILG